MSVELLEVADGKWELLKPIAQSAGDQIGRGERGVVEGYKLIVATIDLNKAWMTDGGDGLRLAKGTGRQWEKLDDRIVRQTLSSAFSASRLNPDGFKAATATRVFQAIVTASRGGKGKGPKVQPPHQTPADQALTLLAAVQGAVRAARVLVSDGEIAKAVSRVMAEPRAGEPIVAPPVDAAAAAAAAAAEPVVEPAAEPAAGDVPVHLSQVMADEPTRTKVKAIRPGQPVLTAAAV